jgi:tRNA threonylcarbamoyladenosine biosynthesis protein TsaB
MLLAVETSGLSGSIALLSEGQVRYEHTLQAEGPRHAQVLVQETDFLLRKAGLTVNDLSAIAVSVGPGSFTGLRVGVVFAKTLAWLQGIPLVAVNSLQAAAWQVPQSHGLVTVISDAQREEVFVQECRWDPLAENWERTGDVRIEKVAALKHCETVIGPVVERHRLKLEEQNAGQLLLPVIPMASGVGKVGMRLIQSADFSCPETLEPLYVRLSYAEEKRMAANG